MACVAHKTDLWRTFHFLSAGSATHLTEIDAPPLSRNEIDFPLGKKLTGLDTPVVVKFFTPSASTGRNTVIHIVRTLHAALSRPTEELWIVSDGIFLSRAGNFTSYFFEKYVSQYPIAINYATMEHFSGTNRRTTLRDEVVCHRRHAASVRLRDPFGTEVWENAATKLLQVHKAALLEGNMIHDWFTYF